jgi:hypothetical protein
MSPIFSINVPLGTQFNLLHLHIRADTLGHPLRIRTRLQFAKVYTESSPMVTRSEPRAAIVDGLSEWKEAGPSDIVEPMNEHEDRGKDNQTKPEHKIVHQRVV